MSFCQYCGSQIGDLDKFCCVCGQPNVLLEQPNINQPHTTQNNSQGQPFQQSIQQGYLQGQQYPQQPIQHGYSQQPFQQQFSQSQLPFNLSPLLYKTIQADNITKEIFDYIQARGWLNQDPSDSTDINFKINDLDFSFPVLDDKSLIINKICIIGCITNFEDNEYEKIAYITMMFPRFEFSSIPIIYSKVLNENDERNLLAFQFILDKSIVSDSLKLFDFVIKDIMEAYQKFIDLYNNL